MKKLYRIQTEVEVTTYAMAENEAEALKLHIKNFEYNPTTQEITWASNVDAVHHNSFIESDWEDDRPYGGDPNDTRTCKEILAEMKRAEKIAREKAEWDARQLKLFDGKPCESSI